MTTLVTLPSARAFQVPTPGAVPILLAYGELTLLLIPANPPTHPSDTITLSVGASAFPLLPTTPVQRVKAKEEHASYTFTPMSPPGAQAMGSILITLASSANQEQWDAAEYACKRFESVLRTHHLWEEKIKFVNDEYDTAGEPVKGWGDSLASAVTAGATFIATKVQSMTDSHVGTTDPAYPTMPTSETAARASGARNATAHLAAKAEDTVTVIGNKVHEAGKELGAKLPEELRPSGQPTAEADKGELRKLAEGGWEQATIAAQGIAGAAVLVGKSLSEGTHRAVEHNFGKESDRVAQDIGQAGTNLASTAGSVFTGTSVIVQGSNVVSGASKTAPTGGSTA